MCYILGVGNVIIGMEITSAAAKILRSFPEEVQDFFLKLEKRCKKRGITLRLSSGKAVNNFGGRCSGYFDDVNKQLAVALGKGWEHSFSVAIHESQHMAQKFDPRSIWHTSINKKHSNFFYWLAGKDFSNPKELARAAMILERDCERRTIAEIRKKYSHLIDPECYTIQANCYLASYKWCLGHRKWLRKSPYDRRLMAHCPPKLFKDFSDISENLEMAMERYL